MEALSERLLKSGLSLEGDWNVNIHLFNDETYSEKINHLNSLIEQSARMPEEYKRLNLLKYCFPLINIQIVIILSDLFG